MIRSPDEKFKAWRLENPDKVDRAINKTMELYGRSREDCLRLIKDAELWLFKTAHTKKTQGRKLWYAFLLNFLKPSKWDKSYGKTRKRISSFDGQPRRG